MDTRVEHIKNADDKRCQAAVPHTGQCQHKAVDGQLYCAIHLATREKAAREKVTRGYNLARWQARVDHFSDHQAVKGLREEIGITRMLLETILNLCQTDLDLLIYASKIGELVGRVESLVKSCHKLESSMGILLDQAAAVQLSGEFVEIIARHVNDEETITAITNEMTAALVRMETANQRVET